MRCARMAELSFLSNWDGAPPGVGALLKLLTPRIGSGGTGYTQKNKGLKLYLLGYNSLEQYP